MEVKTEAPTPAQAVDTASTSALVETDANEPAVAQAGKTAEAAKTEVVAKTEMAGKMAADAARQ
ncbi:hypothetical protein T492DRAFT_867885 [Pavlovales sp. CCMP2436]|nr:hypothetical protein T492DRAFT_867885 [Pavlovales sp. CCMP2436]